MILNEMNRWAVIRFVPEHPNSKLTYRPQYKAGSKRTGKNEQNNEGELR